MNSPKALAAMQAIDDSRELIVTLADKLWDYAELPLHEYRSAEALVAACRDAGFAIEMGMGGMPTAFVATWGQGSPVIGILGEYDALAGLSQEVATERRERVPGGAGHGCQHNLLGAGAFGAALGLQAEMAARGLPGTIKFFGCPAEENLSGKAFMARDGAFDGLDVCLSWHPFAVNRVWSGSTLANNAAYFTFYGRASHAAADPFNGRSALDAVQLMNMGVEFLREHITATGRVHYAITNGGGQPNVVPPEAQVWYLVRAIDRDQVDELWERVIKCARGAAEMTETRFEIEMIKAIYSLLPNETLEDVLEAAFTRVGPPQFGPEERAFGEAIAKTVSPKVREAYLRAASIPAAERDNIFNETLLERPKQPEDIMGSTDVGDVSWCCPVGQIGTACAVLGTPGHSWQSVAQGGMGIGHAGTIIAAKVLAEAAVELVTRPELIEKAQAEFERRTAGRKYRCAMPPEQQPAFHVFAPEGQ